MSELEKLRFCKCPYTVWLSIFLSIQVIQLILMTSSFLSKDWVFTSMGIDSYQSFSVVEFNGTNFKGSLITCTQGCEGSYKSNMKDWCEYSESSETFPSKSMCQLFTSLFYSGFILSMFFGLSVVMIALLVVSLVFYLRKNNIQWVGYCSGCLNFVCIYAAGLFWVLINGVGSEGDCDEFPQGGEKVKVCISDGPKMVLVLMTVIPGFTLFYMVVMSRINKLRTKIINDLNDSREISVLGSSTAALYDPANQIVSDDGSDRRNQLCADNNGKIDGSDRFLQQKEENGDDPGLVVDTHSPLTEIKSKEGSSGS